ncbi:hypothetical protein [Streptomyces sp. NPDC002082]|uniref:hypothetical protein n=1 Tax=Streptomyces sp. NPDC002082 TaxID=3154772 RepID=UPI0033218859
MTTTGLHAMKTLPGAQALRRQAVRTRKELGRLVEDGKLDSARGKAVRAATTVRTHRTAWATATAVLAAALMARRSRRSRREQAV